MPEPAVTEQDLWHDLQPLLDQELSRLPDKYRAVIVLCDLEGKTRKEAARQLGVPEGTVAGRLARARAMLAKRLARRGLAVSGGALAAVLSQNAASAGVPTSVVSSTIKAASLFAAGQAAATGVISAKVAALTEGVLKAMLLTKLKIPLTVAVALTGTGVARFGHTDARKASDAFMPVLSHLDRRAFAPRGPGPVRPTARVVVHLPGFRRRRHRSYLARSPHFSEPPAASFNNDWTSSRTQAGLKKSRL